MWTVIMPIYLLNLCLTILRIQGINCWFANFFSLYALRREIPDKYFRSKIYYNIIYYERLLYICIYTYLLELFVCKSKYRKNWIWFILRILQMAYINKPTLFRFFNGEQMWSGPWKRWHTSYNILPLYNSGRYYGISIILGWKDSIYHVWKTWYIFQICASCTDLKKFDHNNTFS